MSLFVVPPKAQRKPIAAWKFISNSVWRVESVVHAALALQDVPDLYRDFLLRSLVHALRDGAAEIEREIEARRKGGGS